MRETYDILEKMILDQKLSTVDLVRTLTDRIAIYQGVVGFGMTIFDLNQAKIATRTFKKEMEATHIFKNTENIMVQRYRNWERPKMVDRYVDIGNDVTVKDWEFEHLYRFLVRNNVLYPSHTIVLQKLAIEHA